jgi:hypothetical protein
VPFNRGGALWTRKALKTNWHHGSACRLSLSLSLSRARSLSCSLSLSLSLSLSIMYSEQIGTTALDLVFLSLSRARALSIIYIVYVANKLAHQGSGSRVSRLGTSLVCVCVCVCVMCACVHALELSTYADAAQAAQEEGSSEYLRLAPPAAHAPLPTPLPLPCPRLHSPFQLRLLLL